MMNDVFWFWERDEGYYFTYWENAGDEFKPNVFYRKGDKIDQITFNDESLRSSLGADGTLYYTVGTTFENGKLKTHALKPGETESTVIEDFDSWFPSITAHYNVYGKDDNGETAFFTEDLYGKKDQLIIKVPGTPAQFMNINDDETYLTYQIQGELGFDVQVVNLSTKEVIKITDDK